MRVFGLIGQPLTHSFSGAYFENKFRALGLTDHVYHLFPLPDLSDFRDWVESVEGLVGLNVTIPYKQAVLPFLDERQWPIGIEACNCIRIDAGRLIGFNTDIIGFEQSLRPLLSPQHDRALVLGTGGASEAICFVLKQLGIEYRLVGRRRSDTDALLFEELNTDLIEQHRLIINTTPIGTFPHVDECPPIPYEGIGPTHLLYDLVYNPDRTAFMKKGEALGAVVKNGLEMLVGQAEASWLIWTDPLSTNEPVLK